MTHRTAPGIGQLIAAVLAVAIVTWIVIVPPPNDDEFIAFRGLACQEPGDATATAVQDCGRYVFTFGPLHYARAYACIGATSSFVYLPLWRWWPSYWSYVALGALILLAFACALTWTLGLAPRYALVPLTYFPLTFSTLHNTGPVWLALLSLPVLTALGFRIHEARGPAGRMAWTLLAVLLVLVCIEDKVFYVFVLPLMLATVATILGFRSVTLRRETAASVAVFAIGLAVCVLLMLFVGHVDGRSYYDYLRVFGERLVTPVPRQLVAIVRFTLDFPLYGHRIFDVYGLSRTLKYIGALPVAVFGVWLLREGRLSRVLKYGCGIAYSLGVIGMLLSRSAWAAHHYVFLHLPILVLAMAVAAQSQRSFRMVLTGTLATSLASVAILSLTPVHADTARERLRLFAYLRRSDVAASHVTNFSSWGGYFQQSLYGPPEQLVTAVYSLTREESSRLVALGHRTSRDVLNVCLGCTREEMAQVFAPHRVLEVPLGLTYWHAFEVLVAGGAHPVVLGSGPP